MVTHSVCFRVSRVTTLTTLTKAVSLRESLWFDVRERVDHGLITHPHALVHRIGHMGEAGKFLHSDGDSNRDEAGNSTACLGNPRDGHMRAQISSYQYLRDASDIAVRAAALSFRGPLHLGLRSGYSKIPRADLVVPK